MTDAPDTAHSVIVEDHPFLAKKGEEWGLCQEVVFKPAPDDEHLGPYVKCNLARSAHREGPVYEPTAAKAVRRARP